MSTPLTPYDTGAMLEPRVHPGTTGQVDFDDDESTTILTLSAFPTADQDDSVTVQIDTHGSDHVKVIINDGTVFNESIETVGPEPTAAAYAALGRFVAATIGSNTRDWDSNEMTEEFGRFANGLTNFPAISEGNAEEITVWRGIADELGIRHDDDLPEEFESETATTK
jgi:hypothetical protein